MIKNKKYGTKLANNEYILVKNCIISLIFISFVTTLNIVLIFGLRSKIIQLEHILFFAEYFIAVCFVVLFIVFADTIVAIKELLINASTNININKEIET